MGKEQKGYVDGPNSPRRSAAIREIERVLAMPFGDGKSAAAFKQVAELEAEGPQDLLPAALSALIQAYEWADEDEKVLVPLTKMLNLYDVHPEFFPEEGRRNMFRSLLNTSLSLQSYPQVSRTQIEETFADTERRWHQEGLPPHSLIYAKLVRARFFDNPDAEDLFDLWRSTPNDEYTLCPSCVPTMQSTFMAQNDDLDEAIESLEKSIAQRWGRSSPQWCPQEPRDAHAFLASAYLKRGDAGDDEQAVRHYHLALFHRGDDRFAMRSMFSNLTFFLAMARQPAALLQHLVRYSRYFVGGRETLGRLYSQVTVFQATNALINQMGAGQNAIHIANTGAGTVAQLHDWLEAQIIKTGQRFDDRDNFDRFARRFEEIEDLEVRPEPLDLAIRSDLPEDEDAEPRIWLRRAERTSKATGPLNAIEHYRRAAQGFLAQGEVADAGYALAESALLSMKAGDPNAASAMFTDAIVHLTASNQAAIFLSPVRRSFSGLLSESSRDDSALEQLRLALELIDGELVAPSLTPEADTELRKERRAVVLQWAQVLYHQGQWKSAGDLALSTAYEYAEAADHAHAAQSFLTAGRAYGEVSEKEPEALWCLESAVEGFEIAGDRSRRAEAASELEALRTRPR